MKAVILAGGFGTRLSEETQTKPKPLVEVGNKPILWHIMKMYQSHGVNEFIICCGYKGYLIKEYFANYFLHMSDVTFDMENNTMEVHRKNGEDWKVTLVDTGENSMTGGRLKRVASYLSKDESFCFTYGDGLSDVDIGLSIKFHRNHGCKATVTAVRPPGRFGVLAMVDDKVTEFTEKPQGEVGRINGGFFVLEPSVIDYIDGDTMSWELEPLQRLARDGQLRAFCHDGFWQPMDTLREKYYLDNLWQSGNAPWRAW